MKYYYTYTIHFVDGFYYHGRRTSRKPPNIDNYFGSPKTHKEKWVTTQYFKVIEEICNTPEELSEAEYKLIGDKFKTDFYCLNQHNQKKFNYDWSGKSHTIQTKEKISNSKKGNKLTNNHKQQISQLMKNRVITEEHRKNLSISLKGRKFSEEHKQKLRKPKKISPETRIKITKERKNRIITDEHRHKLSLSRKNRIEVTINGTTYPSLAKASLSLGKSVRYIKKHYLTPAIFEQNEN